MESRPLKSFTKSSLDFPQAVDTPNSLDSSGPIPTPIMAETNVPEKVTLQFDSLSVHAGLNRTDNEVKDVPIYPSTSFVFNDSAHGAAIFSMSAEAFCYSRIANPTTDVFEKRIAALEGGAAALATASGEAALFVTITALAQASDNIVVASHISDAAAHLFKHRLPLLGITARFVESGNVDEVRKVVDQNTKAVFVESISTNELWVADIEALASTAHGIGIPLIVDNTHGAGGYFLRPISHGADIVVESAAPWLSISGSNAGGVIIDSGAFPWEKYPSRFPQFSEPSPGFHGLKISEKFNKLAFVAFARIAVMRDIGPCLNPFEAAMLLAGLETLSVRMERVGKNAEALALWLARNERIADVIYPGLASPLSNPLGRKYLTRGYGGLISFVARNNSDTSALLAKFKLVSHGTRVGGSRTQTIATRPISPLVSGTAAMAIASSSGPRVHISVGLEDIEDIKRDFEHAFC